MRKVSLAFMTYTFIYQLPALVLNSHLEDKPCSSTWVSKSFEWVYKHFALLQLVIFMKIFRVMMAFGSFFDLTWQNWGTKWTNTQVVKTSRWSQGFLFSRGEAHSTCYLSSRRSRETENRFLNKCIKSVKKK